MKKQYDGLVAVVVPFTDADIIITSGSCTAMIQLEMVNGVCVSPDYMQQITYVGDKG